MFFYYKIFIYLFSLPSLSLQQFIENKHGDIHFPSHWALLTMSIGQVYVKTKELYLYLYLFIYFIHASYKRQNQEVIKEHTKYQQWRHQLAWFNGIEFVAVMGPILPCATWQIPCFLFANIKVQFICKNSRLL